jgi:lipopolysaccharide export system permease protein
MQREYERAGGDHARARFMLDESIWRANGSKGEEPQRPAPRRLGGIGQYYCSFFRWVTGLGRAAAPKVAYAATLPFPAPAAVAQAPQAALNPDEPIDITIQRAELESARRRRDRYGIEIQKKFSLAAACIVLAFVGAPIALRFPRGGVGLVIGVSFGIFALYYVGLIGGESLANKGYVSPFIAMWAANIIFFRAGSFLYWRMGHEASSARGGDLREWLYLMRLRMRGQSPLEAGQ